MRNSMRAALAIGLGLAGVAGLVAPSMGQQPQDAGVRQAAANNAAPPAPKPAPAAVVGVIDMQQVLKNYDKLKVAMEGIQADAMARSNELMKLQSEGRAEAEKLQKLAPGSLDQKKIEDKLSELKVRIQTMKEQAQMDFDRREAEITSTIYNEIHHIASGVAKQRGMNLVVQSSNSLPTATDPNSIQMAMMRAVVVADPKLDITSDVIYYLNYYYRKSGAPAPKGDARAAAAPAANPAPAAAGAAAEAAPRR